MNVLSLLSQVVNAGKLGGWVRAGVAAGIGAAIARWPLLGQVLDPSTQAEIGVAVSGVVVGFWSHYVKS